MIPVKIDRIREMIVMAPDARKREVSMHKNDSAAQTGWRTRRTVRVFKTTPASCG